MNRRRKNLRDWWIFAISTISGISLVVSGVASLSYGLADAASALISLLIGLPLGIVNAAAWRDAEIERQAIADQEGPR